MHIAGFVNGARVNFPRLTLNCRVISEGFNSRLREGTIMKALVDLRMGARHERRPM